MFQIFDQHNNSHMNLMIMVFERHLQVKPHKLCEVPVCVRVFCSEHPTNSEDLKDQAAKTVSKQVFHFKANLVKVSSNGHLLVKLWRLRKES